MVDASSASAIGSNGNDQPAVLFSSLIGRDKVDNETLERCCEVGVDFDLQLAQSPPDLGVELMEEVDIDAERAKADSCPYWKEGKEEFLSNFNLKDSDSEYVSRVNELLYSFCHVFHDERHPEQFRKGIKMAPLVIKRVPGKTPRKQRVRQMSDKKLGYLKKHIETLVSQGVLEELRDVTDCHSSPAHIVIESRLPHLKTWSSRKRVLLPTCVRSTSVPPILVTLSLTAIVFAASVLRKTSRFPVTSIVVPSFTNLTWTRKRLTKTLVCML